MTMRNRILDTAVSTALRDGWHALTRERIASAASVATGSINTHFGTMSELRDEVMKVAVRDGHAGIVAAGLGAGHPVALAAPAEVRQAAVAALAA